MIGGLCLRGCCEKVAYLANNPWGNYSFTYEDIGIEEVHLNLFGFPETVEELLSDHSVKILFLGNDNNCGTATPHEEEWQPIKDWVTGGGRAWFQTEYGPASSIGDDTFSCLRDREDVQSFLAFMGGLQYKGGAKSGGCGHAFCIPGAAAIANGSDDFMVAATAEMAGGTSVWIEPEASKVCVVGEQIGEGFFFATGDSNTSSGCGIRNVDFFRRLLQTQDGLLL